MSVRFALEVRVKPGREDDLERAYAAIHDRLEQGVPGLMVHQLCRAQGDERRWLVTSEWESEEANQAWEGSQEHHDLTIPMRDCFEEAKLTRYEVRNETRV